MSRILFTIVVLLLSSVTVLAAEATTTAASQPATTQPAQPTNDLERVAQQTVDILDRATAALAGVKDEASAKEAATKITAMKKDVDAMKAAAAKLGQPSDEQQAAMISKYAKTLEKSYLKLLAEQSRISKDPAQWSVVEKPMMDLGLVKAAATTTTTAP
jgi:ABC-type transporter MlaC component